MLIERLVKSRRRLWRAYLTHVAWFVATLISAAYSDSRPTLVTSLLLTFITIPPVLYFTVAVHKASRAIKPSIRTVGWVPVIVATIFFTPFESGLLMPAKNLWESGRLLKQIQGTDETSIRAGRGQDTSQFVKQYLILAGVAASAGAALHIAIPFGGPDWYAFFGAPKGLVDMARAGSIRAPISCLVIAAFLALLAAYAFSGASVIRRLPFLRTGLAAIAGVLILRGALFIPLILLRPSSLTRICNCGSVDIFIITTSVLCLAMGFGYALGALASPNNSFKPKPLRGSA
jgi:putative oxidoreductase